eukprot:CAMPEP_0117017448 /NCGR_PEP_ID=MMETSP0472-20121206/13621_1 /TAXON_ID=693140 ORGANISM="Tiarina fusus, Strain LIS" /NCGR_SAMPLE_ID=MMETSP0472 /ASSEMBLY_ACC=CAM_ASM_000603 /LENGTH=373 /DNA_ID=CAMNT_0004721813 /DNA_START=63 /DNA_END=1184 /DNA_ORIENTATION=-
MRAACLATLKIGRRKLSSSKNGIGTGMGIATAGVFFALAHILLEESSPSSTYTRLQGPPSATCPRTGDRSSIVEDVFWETLSQPLGLGPFLKQKLRELKQQVQEESDVGGRSETQKRYQPTARFPSLQTQLLSTTDGEEAFFAINSNEPIAIKNDMFEGYAMLVLRPLALEDDPDFKRRVHDNRATFQLQLQGKFKKPVRKDRLYIGAELAAPKMDLRYLEMKAAQAVLMFLSNCIGRKAVTYSFGTSTERPHISFPLHKGVQQLIVSSNMSTEAPRMGSQFRESNESRQKRKNDDFPGWDPNAVYSMSYIASSVDLSAWKLLLPLEMNLKRFWGDSALRLVIYEDSDESQEKDYLFNLQIKHLPYPQDSPNQ